MADSSPPQDSEPESKPSEPPPASDPDPKPSDEDAPSDEADEEAPSSDSERVPPSRVSMIELELEPDPSLPGKPPSRPPPPPLKKPSSAPDDARPLPKPGFKSAVPEAPPKGSILPPRKFPPDDVGDIMTRKLIALTEKDTVENIESGMQRFRFRHLPVVTEENKLIGLVTHRDLLRAEAEAARKSPDGNGTLAKSTPVGKVMNRDILTTSPDMDLTTAGKAMLQKKIGCLPVILEDQTLVGIVTEADFIKLVIQLLDQGKKKEAAEEPDAADD